jgi:hypothetical protein
VTAERGRFDPAPVLAGLKDFQRRTVDYVFRRLYTDPAPTRRMLVADEVGLGKTLVARGVIARALQHLHGVVERIDVVYVCSNATIAHQNVDKLNVLEDEEIAIATRLTLLPTNVRDLAARPVNFISFTPGTTFDLKSRGGRVEERALLYHLLRCDQWFGRAPLRNVLQGGASKETWDDHTRRAPDVDPQLADAYRRAVWEDAALAEQLVGVCDRFRRYRESVSAGDREQRNALVGALRQKLAKVCVSALEPDLVILDEFQRFKDLLDGDDDAAALARELLTYPDVRVLLLSATPYRMLSLDHEQEDDHYPDFVRTLRFLFGGDAAAEAEVAALRDEIRGYRRALFSLADGDAVGADEARGALQTRLRRVMCRTERVGITARADAMLAEPPRPAPLDARDLGQAALADRTAEAVGARDPIEYWKSAPYLLNFLREYQLGRQLDAAMGAPSRELLALLRGADGHLLTQRQFERYERIDPGNARMRSLSADTLDRGLWRLLWLPPSLPYAAPAGAFADVGDVTKALVFSCWNAVPNAIAALLSYEAERRMVEDVAQGWGRSELYDRLEHRLRFARGKDGRPASMPTLALLHPSPTLAEAVDPLRTALAAGGGAPVLGEVLVRRAEEALAPLLSRLTANAPTAGDEDPDWCWAAPALLDAGRSRRFLAWCEADDGWRGTDAPEEDELPSVFVEHVQRLVDAARRRVALGRPPADLARVVAELAVASPGTCALRALRRVVDLPVDHAALLTAAARVASGFRTLFNVPESMALLRAGGGVAPPWRLVLGYARAGNLQAVLDEQVHVLVDELGGRGKGGEKRAAEVARKLEEALSIRTTQLQVDELAAQRDAPVVRVKPFRTRCRFALRFADLKGDQDQTLRRAESVREAFNSPFRPFVLASTSIGQEGLDFHRWCHAVVHWNLPTNPVDLEQREGRVHRYKGHAIRKNVARRFGLGELAAGWSGQGDPWEHLFERAVATRDGAANDLVPYWVYETEGGARVERRVPLLPYSREVEQLARLKRSLALYRLVFGQPRQEDLLAHLTARLSDADAQKAAAAWRLSLAPE